LHIEEVDRRKMNLGMAYPNLFEYLTKHLGYSAGSAQRRIDAARLVKDVPSLPEKLKSGDLSLGQVTLVQKSIRQKVASTKRSQISKEMKQSLIEEISGLSFQESQKTVAQTLDLEIKEASKVQVQKDESVRLEITFKKEGWQILQQARELLSNSLPHGSWDQVFTYLAKKEIRQKTELRSEKIKASRHVTTAKHKVIFKKDQCCVYTDQKTGRKCASKWFLQDDHIQPKWAGGSNDLENLQILCASHNRHKYRQQAGLS